MVSIIHEFCKNECVGMQIKYIDYNSMKSTIFFSSFKKYNLLFEADQS